MLRDERAMVRELRRLICAVESLDEPSRSLVRGAALLRAALEELEATPQGRPLVDEELAATD